METVFLPGDRVSESILWNRGGHRMSSMPSNDTELVLNLWAFMDSATGVIFRISGKAYAMSGSDADKLSLLRALSATDYLSVGWHKVPSNVSVVDDIGRSVAGATHVSGLDEQHSLVFGPLVEEFARQVPDQLRSVRGEYQPFKPELPENPLTVTTIVVAGTGI